MLRRRKRRFTAKEYLAMEEVAADKNEYHQGEIFALSGGSADHSLIATNLTAVLAFLLADRPCRVFNSDLRIYVRASDLYTYPDVLVVCGRLQFWERRNDTIMNPSLIVEVLSPSTRDYDRGPKFAMYRELPTLQECVLVDSERELVECYRRDDAWTVTSYAGLDAVCRFDSLDVELPLVRIYSKVTWLE